MGIKHELIVLGGTLYNKSESRLLLSLYCLPGCQGSAIFYCCCPFHSLNVPKGTEKEKGEGEKRGESTRGIGELVSLRRNCNDMVEDSM